MNIRFRRSFEPLDPRCFFTNAWDSTAPPGSQAASLGDNRIREFKVDVDERLMTGTAAAKNALIDLGGTRTLATDPVEPNPGKYDTAALEAGTVTSLTRAVTYFDQQTSVGDFTNATGNWTAITNLRITVPATVLNTTGVIEHVNGSSIPTGDYVLWFSVQLLATPLTTGASRGIFRIRNTTDSLTIGPGDAVASGGAATAGVRTFLRSFMGNDTQWLSWHGRDNSRTRATTYDVECASLGGGGITVFNSLTDGRFNLQIFKR